MIKVDSRRLAGAGIAVLAAMTLAGASAGSATAQKPTVVRHLAAKPVSVRIISPRYGDNAGISGAGWIVNLGIRYPGGGSNGLHVAGFTGPQITGPAGHNNIAPFPGTFSPGKDDRLPGLVVLDSTTTGFSGPGTNLANLFNTTGVGDRTSRSTEILDNWIVGANLFGSNTKSVLTVAVVKDRNKNGVYDDAPDVVPDANNDHRIDATDLRAVGLASNVATVSFRINGAA